MPEEIKTVESEAFENSNTHQVPNAKKEGEAEMSSEQAVDVMAPEGKDDKKKDGDLESPENGEEKPKKKPFEIHADPLHVGNNGLSMETQDDEVQELLGHPPSWMLKFGITLMFLIVLGLLLLATIVKYPDVVEAEVVLTSNNPPITLYSKASGKIDQLFVADQQKVEKDDLLMIIESDAKFDDILEAESSINRIKAVGENYRSLMGLTLPEQLNLGTIKNSYSSLLATLSAMQYFLKDNSVNQKVKLFKGGIEYNVELHESIQNQLDIYEKEIELEEKNFSRNRALEKEGLVSKVEFEKIEKQYVQSMRSLEQLKMSIINNKISTDQLKSSILDLEADRKSKLQNYFLQMTEKMAIVEKEIIEWKTKYLFYSTHDGLVSLIGFRANDEFVNQLDPVMTIIPESPLSAEARKIIARAKVTQIASGKIEEGNEVSIRLESFPFKEFGVIKSEIESISLLPFVDDEGKRHYTMDIPLAHPIVTTYNTTIPFRPNQSGIAKIITKDRSLAGRVFEQFIDLVKNS